jgi:DNA-binding NarL/FixJ family response regulator
MSEGCIMKIFIVDDSAIIVERVKILLSVFEELEFIGQASNVNDAVEAILKLKPDVVILDIRLVGGNGMKVLERIKKEEPSPLVIMLTNYPYPQYREKCRHLGAEYFFDKVTEIESFVKVLKFLAQDSSQGELPL